MYCISLFPCQSRQLLVENAHKEHHEPLITFKFLHFLEAVGRARSEAVASSNMKHHTESDTVVLLQADRFGRSATCCTSQPNHGRRPERVVFVSRVLIHEATAPFIIIGLMTLIMASIQNLEQIAAISPFHNIRSCRQPLRELHLQAQSYPLKTYTLTSQRPTLSFVLATHMSFVYSSTVSSIALQYSERSFHSRPTLILGQALL